MADVEDGGGGLGGLEGDGAALAAYFHLFCRGWLDRWCVFGSVVLWFCDE